MPMSVPMTLESENVGSTCMNSRHPNLLSSDFGKLATGSSRLAITPSAWMIISDSASMPMVTASSGTPSSSST